jgi:hypothetical protein
MTNAKIELEAFKESMKKHKAITPWDSIEVNCVYHIPPIKSLSRRDVLIMEKDNDTIKYKRIDDTEKKEGNMARTSVYAKVMVKRKKY